MRCRRRRRHHGQTASAATPTTPAAVPARPRFSAFVVEYRRLTSLVVGTTTMKLGVARHGPSAPCALQLGKYDVLTITGTPVRDTRNDTEWSVVRTLVTVTGGSDRVGTASMAGSFGVRAPSRAYPGCARLPRECPSATNGRSRSDRTRASAAGGLERCL